MPGPSTDDHPRAPNDKRSELELCLRDAYAAGCQAAASRSLITAMDYAKRQAPIVAERIQAFDGRKTDS